METDPLIASDPLLSDFDSPRTQVTEILSYWKQAPIYCALNKSQIDPNVFVGHAYIDRQLCHKSRIPLKHWSGLQHELRLDASQPIELLFSPLCAVHKDHATDLNPPLLSPFWLKICLSGDGAWEIPKSLDYWIPPIFLSTVSATYPIFGSMTAYENYLLVADPMENFTMASLDTIVSTLFKTLTGDEFEKRLSQSGYQLINEALLINPRLVNEHSLALDAQLTHLQGASQGHFLDKLICFEDVFKDKPLASMAVLNDLGLVESFGLDSSRIPIARVDLTNDIALIPWLLRTCQYRWIDALVRELPIPSVGIVVGTRAEAERLKVVMNKAFGLNPTEEDEWTIKQNFNEQWQLLNQGLNILKALQDFYPLIAAEAEGQEASQEQANFSDDDSILEQEFDQLAQAKLNWVTFFGKTSWLERIGLKRRERQERIAAFIKEYLPLGQAWEANDTLIQQLVARQRAIRVARTKIHMSMVPIAQTIVQQNVLVQKWNAWQEKALEREDMILEGTSIDAVNSLCQRAYQAMDEHYGAVLSTLARSSDLMLSSLAWDIREHAMGYTVAQFGDGPLSSLIVLNAERVSPLALAPYYESLSSLTVVGETREEHNYSLLPPTLDLKVIKEILGDFGEEIDEYYAHGLTLSRGHVWGLAQQEALQIGRLISEHSALAPLSRRPSKAIEFEVLYERWPTLGLLDTQGQSQAWAGSYRNFDEAKTVVEWLTAMGPTLKKALLEKGYAPTVLILTPYAAQAEILLSLIPSQVLSVRVEALASAFEGASIVLYSSVHTSEDCRPFCQDEGLGVFNKVLMLAHHALWIIGDRAIFNAAEHSPSGLLASRLFADSRQMLPATMEDYADECRQATKYEEFCEIEQA